MHQFRDIIHVVCAVTGQCSFEVCVSVLAVRVPSHTGVGVCRRNRTAGPAPSWGTKKISSCFLHDQAHLAATHIPTLSGPHVLECCGLYHIQGYQSHRSCGCRQIVARYRHSALACFSHLARRNLQRDEKRVNTDFPYNVVFHCAAYRGVHKRLSAYFHSYAANRRRPHVAHR